MRNICLENFVLRNIHREPCFVHYLTIFPKLFEYIRSELFTNMCNIADNSTSIKFAWFSWFKFVRTFPKNNKVLKYLWSIQYANSYSKCQRPLPGIQIILIIIILFTIGAGASRRFSLGEESEETSKKLLHEFNSSQSYMTFSSIARISVKENIYQKYSTETLNFFSKLYTYVH